MERPISSLILISILLLFLLPDFSSSLQNFETFYPLPIQTPSLPPKPPINISPNSSTSLTPAPAPALLPALSSDDKSSSSKRNVVKAVAATAASTFVVATLLFFLTQRFVIAPRRRKEGHDSRGGQPPADAPFSVVHGNLKGLVVDENGLDVLYWRKLEGDYKKNSFDHRQEEEEEHDDAEDRRKCQPIQEIPLLRGKSSTSLKKVVPETTVPTVTDQSIVSATVFKAIEKPNLTANCQPPPRPPPSITNKQVPAPPQPPPIPAKKNHTPPPPPPKASSNLPPLRTRESVRGEGTQGSGNGQVKLKPLHWDKVSKNTGHSMVWDKIDGGSFRFDDDLMEALFGCVATNRKSPHRDNSSIPKNSNYSLSAQIVILDARKSQNIAIVLKSLAISRDELLNALNNGQGLNSDTLEKLMRIAPTKEEESQILEFDGDPTRLADAESFIYYLLKAVPSAFARLNAMLFRSNYDAEVLQLRESLQILESGCQELRNRGLFMKLLEAVLKAGNRMNAGTSRGNAQAFKLTSLGKLSDVKSIDGKTTLLHFVVEEVVRSQGKRCVLNRNRSLIRNSSQRSNSSVISENSASKGEREKEYMMLGLPAVGGLSAEFTNVKKAAQIDYDTFVGTCSALTARAREVGLSVTQCAATNGEWGFVKEMKVFLEAAEEELKALTEEQTRIMKLVKKTTEYYHAGASKDQEANLLQIFVIIKDFLYMVDQVCVEIARNLQRRKTPSSPKSPASRVAVRFPNLPEHFMKEKSMSSWSESDTDF